MWRPPRPPHLCGRGPAPCTHPGECWEDGEQTCVRLILERLQDSSRAEETREGTPENKRVCFQASPLWFPVRFAHGRPAKPALPGSDGTRPNSNSGKLLNHRRLYHPQDEGTGETMSPRWGLGQSPSKPQKSFAIGGGCDIIILLTCAHEARKRGGDACGRPCW